MSLVSAEEIGKRIVNLQWAEAVIPSTDKWENSACKLSKLIQECSTRGVPDESSLTIWIGQKATPVNHFLQVWQFKLCLWLTAARLGCPALVSLTDTFHEPHALLGGWHRDT
jgi:hypothetical protein